MWDYSENNIKNKNELADYLTASLKPRMHSSDGKDSLVLLSDVIKTVTKYMEDKENKHSKFEYLK